MAYSYTAFTGNGSTTQYAVAFPYIRREHVAVTVAGVPSTFTWVNNSLIQMDAAPANGAAVRVYRTTPISAPLVDFADGATLVAADLDTNSRQSIYIQQELDDAQTDNLPNVIPNGNKGDITTSVGGTVWAINNGAVLEAKIATGAVTETKLGTGSVTSAKILDGTIVDADVNASAGIVATKLAFTQSGTGATVRTVDSKLKDVVSVKDFGAVGDGVADDTAAINAALALGGRIYFPATANYYRITDDLVMADGTTVEGDGWKSEIRQVTQGKNVFVAGNDCVISRVHVKMPVGNNLDLTKQNAVYISGKKNVVVENNWLELADIAVSGVQMRASFQVTVKGNIVFGGLWSGGAGPNASAADILMYSSAPGGRTIIESNYCLSNNSQGIFCSALGQDADIVVANNVCVTLDTTTCTQGGAWSEAASGGTRRHGILAAYSTATAGTPRLVINGNICRNTRWTGIYKQGASSGPVIISNNVCTLNGYENQPLAGGIFIYQTGDELVSGNTVDRCQAINASTGGITVISSESAPPSMFIVGNCITRSAGFGISFGTNSHAVEVRGNTFLDNTSADIRQAPTGGLANVAGHRFIGNRITRTSGNTISAISLDCQSSTLVTRIWDNDITGFDNTNNSNTNTGVYVLGQSPRASIRDNRIQGFYHGIIFAAYQTTNRDAQIEANEIRDCTNGISIGATTTTVTVPVVDNRFVGILGSRLAAALGGQFGGRLVQRMGQRLQWETTAAPTQGAWEVGDRSVNTTPAVGQPKSWVCTVAGSPGTWVSEGNL